MFLPPLTCCPKEAQFQWVRITSVHSCLNAVPQLFTRDHDQHPPHISSRNVIRLQLLQAAASLALSSYQSFKRVAFSPSQVQFGPCPHSVLELRVSSERGHATRHCFFKYLLQLRPQSRVSPLSVRLSVCLSVCLSLSFLHCECTRSTVWLLFSAKNERFTSSSSHADTIVFCLCMRA